MTSDDVQSFGFSAFHSTAIQRIDLFSRGAFGKNLTDGCQRGVDERKDDVLLFGLVDVKEWFVERSVVG